MKISEIRNRLAVVAHNQQAEDFRRESHGDRPHAAVAHDKLTNAGVIAAESSLWFEIAAWLFGNRKPGAAAPSDVAGHVPAAVVRRKVSRSLAERAQPNVFFTNENGVAGAVAQRAQAGSTMPAGYDLMDNRSVPNHYGAVCFLIVQIPPVASPV